MGRRRECREVGMTSRRIGNPAVEMCGSESFGTFQGAAALGSAGNTTVD